MEEVGYCAQRNYPRQNQAIIILIMSLLEKMRGNTGTWTKVSNLAAGVEIAVPGEGSQMQPQHLHWDEIVSITPVGREHVYDIEVEGTHNFVGNGIFAHNTYVLRANTMLAVEGEVNAGRFVVPVPDVASAPAALPSATSTLLSQLPPEVLTADGKGIDLYKLSTYNLVAVHALAARLNDDEVRVTSLESRVTALESGAISSENTSLISLSTTSLASAFEGLSAYISKGFAQFGTLIADRFVAATNSAGTSSASTVNIITGNTVAQVTNEYVLPTSKIFVTFNSQITGSWWVSDKQNGSFRVVLSAAQTADVSFDYFLVQTEGQVATSTSDGTQNSISNTNTTPVAISSSNDTASSTPPTPPEPVATTTPPTTSDTIAPVVTLNGDAAIQLTVGDVYTDAGATATDDVDGDLTTKIVKTGTVDTATAGSYSITYSATDKAGNIGSAGRIVVVSVAPAASSTPPDTTIASSTSAI